MIRGVPYDAEVEWIRPSSFGPYINTGIDARSVYGVLFEFKYSVVRYGYNSILSGALDNFTLGFGSPQGSFYLRVHNSIKGGSFALDANAWHRLTIDRGNGAISIGGMTSSTTLPCATKEGNVTIFSNSEHSRFCDVFVRGLVLVGAGGVKLRDMVPVRIGTSCAMYDRVSRKLFRNNGSGAFSYGPDVVTPVMGLHFTRRGGGMTSKDYIQDGLIWQVDGIENAGFGVHLTSPSSWVDLVGGNDVSLVSDGQTVGSKSVSFSRNGTGGVLSSSISGVYALDFCLSVSRRDEQAVFSATDNHRIMWYYNGTMGAGASKKGFVHAVGIPCTIYADGDYGSFSARAKNGVVYSPDGVSDSYSWITKTGFSFRGNGYPFIGEVFSGRAYSRPLTADEILHNHLVDKARFGIP